MDTQKPIEEKLKELGQAIDSDESFVKDVVNHIQTKSTARPKYKIRRMIMIHFTKLAAAAVIIIAALISLTIFDGSLQEAYAIEQTIEAFKNVRFLHLTSFDEDGAVDDERWIEIGAHGRQVRYRQQTPPNFLVIEDGTTTAVYYKDKKTIVLYSNKDKQYQWIGDLGEFLENLRQEGQIIEENTDYYSLKAHKVLWPMMNAECYIDAGTKLPISIGGTELSYEQPPEEIFEIVTPQDYVVIDKRLGAAAVDEPEWLLEEKNADVLFRQARYSLAAGDYEQAAELFEYVVEIQPRRNWAWFWLGDCYYELERYDLAIQSYSKVIEMMGVVPYCCYGRSLAYAQQGEVKMAAKDLAEALPWMIQALREPTAAAMFEYADDPTLRDGGKRPTEKQIIVRMINRLRIATGQNFNYVPDAGVEENEQAVSSWENWFENSGQIQFSPEAELLPTP